jgi:hypothetical protein
MLFSASRPHLPFSLPESVREKRVLLTQYGWVPVSPDFFFTYDDDLVKQNLRSTLLGQTQSWPLFLSTSWAETAVPRVAYLG